MKIISSSDSSGETSSGDRPAAVKFIISSSESSDETSASGEDTDRKKRRRFPRQFAVNNASKKRIHAVSTPIGGNIIL